RRGVGLGLRDPPPARGLCAGRGGAFRRLPPSRDRGRAAGAQPPARRPGRFLGGPRGVELNGGSARERPAAMGCMRLSTDPDRDDARAIATLHAALDAGVTLLDTADAYARDDSEIGHNERLVASALSSWRGDRSRITVATK